MDEVVVELAKAGAAGVAVTVGYFWIRREWVFRHRVRVLLTDLAIYGQLPSFEEMLYARWWEWRWHRLLEP